MRNPFRGTRGIATLAGVGIIVCATMLWLQFSSAVMFHLTAAALLVSIVGLFVPQMRPTAMGFIAGSVGTVLVLAGGSVIWAFGVIVRVYVLGSLA